MRFSFKFSRILQFFIQEIWGFEELQALLIAQRIFPSFLLILQWFYFFDLVWQDHGNYKAIFGLGSFGECPLKMALLTPPRSTFLNRKNRWKFPYIWISNFPAKIYEPSPGKINSSKNLKENSILSLENKISKKD